MRVLLDANAALRYLLADNPEMAAKTKSAIEFGAFLLPEVLAEIVYVLSGVYSVPRPELAAKLIVFLGEVDCGNPVVLRAALNRFGTTKLDFVDCLLLAYHDVLGDSVLTFDKAMRKALGGKPPPPRPPPSP
jgi:predicted nucleic acid-binding protein